MFAEIAPRLVDNGWPSPIPVVGKRPVVPGWDALNNRAVTDDELEEWCRRFPRVNVGHAVGNGLVFIDQDILDAALADVVDQARLCIFGSTPAVRIGRAPKRLSVYRGTGIASRKCHPIEIFGDTGQAVFYGTHPDTRLPYHWIDEDPLGLTPDDLPTITAAQVDAFLAAAARVVTAPTRQHGQHSARSAAVIDLDHFRRLRTERTATRGRTWLAVLKRQLRDAQPGTLHNTLLSVTVALVRCGFTDRRIRSFIRRHFNAPRSGPYADVWKQVDDAIAGARKRWDRTRDDADFEARVLRGARAMSTVPTPRDEMFAGLAGDVVDVFGPYTEASPVAIAVQFAVAFGNAVGPTPRFYVGETAHRTNEFLMMPGDTSRARKGDAGNIIRCVFEEADWDWATRCWKSGLSSGEGLIFHVRDQATKTATEGKHAGKIVVTDQGVTDKRLLAYETEATSVLKQTDRKGNTLSNITRDAWDHKNLGTLTRNNPLVATQPHISMVAHCTVEDLLAHLTGTEAANGWANRFLYAKVHRAQKLASPGRADRLAVEALAEAVRDALEFGRSVGEMRRTPSAERLWCAAYDRLTEDHPGLLGQLTARAEAHVVRLSMLFALFCGSKVIDEQHLRSALCFWLYCFESTRLIFGNRTGNTDADRLKEGLLPGEKMTFSDVREDIFAGHITAARLQAAVDLLIKTNEVRIEEERTGGRPAKVVYRLTEVERQKSEESWESYFGEAREAVG